MGSGLQTIHAVEKVSMTVEIEGVSAGRV